jgi:hypothetical protein
MTDDRTNKWYHLYSNNRAIYPSDNQYADGYISDSYDDDMRHSLDEIAEAADKVTDSYRYNTSQVHIWRDSADQGYNFKMPDSYWEEQQRRKDEDEDENEEVLVDD